MSNIPFTPQDFHRNSSQALFRQNQKNPYDFNINNFDPTKKKKDTHSKKKLSLELEGPLLDAQYVPRVNEDLKIKQDNFPKIDKKQEIRFKEICSKIKSMKKNQCYDNILHSIRIKTIKKSKNFTCPIFTCFQTFSTFQSLKNHFTEKHGKWSEYGFKVNQQGHYSIDQEQL